MVLVVVKGSDDERATRSVVEALLLKILLGENSKAGYFWVITRWYWERDTSCENAMAQAAHAMNQMLCMILLPRLPN